MFVNTCKVWGGRHHGAQLSETGHVQCNPRHIPLTRESKGEMDATSKNSRTGRVRLSYLSTDL